jgi:RimJ/RimL family protein N-acetyltransferase
MIKTHRLLLAPNSPEALNAIIDASASLQAVSGYAEAPGLREFFSSDEMSSDWLEELRQADSPDLWSHGFLVIERESELAVGACAFKGPPDSSGLVEIAYGIVPDFEGRGYATEAARALVEQASREEEVKLVRAHTLPLPNASTRVLEKCGFRFVGPAVDPYDGEVWRWERDLEVPD